MRSIRAHSEAGRDLNHAPLAVLMECARGNTRTLLERALEWSTMQGSSRSRSRSRSRSVGHDVEIRFDLRGKVAGQVRIGADGQVQIRYNLGLLEREGAAFLEHTVPHEVAHVLAYWRHGSRIRPHGPEWQRIMHQLGAEPTRCHDYDISGLQARQLRYFDYHCGCMEHRLSSIRHNKVAKGQCYLCKHCGEPLKRGSRGAAVS